MKYTIALIAAAASFTSPAAAQVRVGVHGGGDRVSADGEHSTGIFGGVHVGFDGNSANSNTFAGVEAEFDLSNVEDCQTGTIVAGDKACVKAGRDIGVNVRGGFRPTDTSKLYLLVGYSNARARFTYSSAALNTSDHENLDGARVGAGYEFDIGQSSYAKVEYRYTNYEQDVSRHQLLAGFGFKF